MKTKNNVQKKVARVIAVVACSVLICGTVSAREKVELNNEKFVNEAICSSEIAEVDAEDVLVIEPWMTDESNLILDLNVDTEIDETLEVEAWMTDESAFYNVALMQDAESALELENWMTSDVMSYGVEACLELENDKALVVEDWMTGEDYSKVKQLKIEQEKEDAMKIESWMINQKVRSI